MKILKKVSVDTIQLYLAHSAELHPLIYNQFVESLTALELKGKLCPVPIIIFERFHLKLKKAS